MQRIRQHEQPRQSLIGLAREFGANALNRFDRGQIDIDDHAGEVAGGVIGEIENRDCFDVTGVAQDVREFFALILDI